MRWHDTDPGAGQPDAVRALARLLDTTTVDLHHATGHVRTATDPLGPDTWTGNAATAWAEAHQATEDNLHHLTGDLAPAGDALRAYADEIEAIAYEADLARTRQADALADLTHALAAAPPPSTPAEGRRRRENADDDRAKIDRSARATLEYLADDRRRADTRLVAALAPARRADWDAIGEITVTVPKRATVPVSATSVGATGDRAGDSAGSGGVLRNVLQRTWKLASRSILYREYLRAAHASPFGQTVVTAARAEAVLGQFIDGTSHRILSRIRQSRFVLRAGELVPPKIAVQLSKVTLGKLSLAGVFASGVLDLVTGGGYDGARGATTRVLGAAGAAGAMVLRAGGAALAGTVAAPIAMGAVVIYGAWSLGNLAWDNREKINSFVRSVGPAVNDFVTAVGTSVWNAGRAVWHTHVAGASAAGRAAEQIAGVVGQVASDALSTASSWLSNARANATSTASGWLSDRIRRIGDTVSTAPALGRVSLPIPRIGLP